MIAFKIYEEENNKINVETVICRNRNEAVKNHPNYIKIKDVTSEYVFNEKDVREMINEKYSDVEKEIFIKILKTYDGFKSVDLKNK